MFRCYRLPQKYIYLIELQTSSYASRGNFKDGLRYGKYGPVGSDKKTHEEKVHTSKQYYHYKGDKANVTLIYFSVVPIIMLILYVMNLYKGSKTFKSDTVLK